MENWWFTDNWNASQFQAFLYECWRYQRVPTPLEGKAFEETITFKELVIEKIW